MSKFWGAHTSWDEVCRRAAGRAKYHALRRLERDLRRRRVLRLLARHGLGHGVQARIARKLGVAESTISRDTKALLCTFGPCPACGTLVRRDAVSAARPQVRYL